MVSIWFTQSLPAIRVMQTMIGRGNDDCNEEELCGCEIVQYWRIVGVRNDDASCGDLWWNDPTYYGS